ncbi:hypothetical protein BGZ97_005318 [Linnemannia gamsii]|uniref:WD40 repeat-like protein n=1 Tax=Linnemannia gamsii TaxID=64522 RepID=A0A9P6QQP4_9FUNG|nr:hypothetical protein BGZ97_005318 [Linnemannia gamsii]
MPRSDYFRTLHIFDHPLEQLDSQVHDSDSINSTVSIRMRDKFRKFLGMSKSKSESKDVKPMTSNRSSSIVSQVSNDPPGNNQSVLSLPDVHEAKSQPSPPNKSQVIMDIFPHKVLRPVIKTALPRLHERIESTVQLVYCTSLLLQGSLPPSAVHGDDVASDAALCFHEATLNKAELDWLEEMKKYPMEQDHLRWLLTRMVEAFVADNSKDSVKIAEIVALGPVLQKEPYRKLLSSLIKDFGDARILDANLLQGLVELVQSTSSGYLVSNDLVSILSILRARLQGTHLQSTEYSYHLILAVSKVLDVMADHKVQDLDRVLQHEPLSGVLSGLKGSSDPYLMYQACYAFQALQYVPDDESALQAVLRHSTGVVDGLVKVYAVFKLDLASVLEGLGSLQESIGGIVGVVTTVYEGASSLMESGQGVFDSLREGLNTGQKRPWYPAIKAAYAFAQAGQLKDLRQLIFEAPCRRDPLFQWGICQLLGEIAVNPVWAVATRQQATTLLGHLFKVDRDWGHDGNVRAWMLTIVTKLASNSDHAVNTIAHALLQDLNQNKNTSSQHPYPLTARLPIPVSSPILAKVHNIPSVEYDLHKLIVQRLKEAHLPIYIPPMAKANLQASDDDLFPLMDKVQEFLASDRQVMLILGDSGSGKSTFNSHLESVLLQSYTRGGRIPLFINLPAIREPEKELITEQLKSYHFAETKIQELRQQRQFVVICDGYDESQLTTNLHTSNFFNRPDQWDVKLIISCRSQYLGQDYYDRFVPKGAGHYSRPTLDLFQEAAIAPFSKEQIQDYVELYVPLEPRTWTTQDYMSRLTIIPNLIDLVKNPFLLSLSLEALPKVTEGQLDFSIIKITRVLLYDIFVEHWLDVNKRRLQGNVLSKEDRAMLDDLLDAGFVTVGLEFSTKLASAIFDKQEGNPVVHLLIEPSIIQFLCERVKQHPYFEKQLLAVIELSKTDPSAATAAANAITILVRAGVRFNGADLRGIKIPGADLSGSQLDSAHLQDADLTDVIFARSWMRQVDLSGAQMNGVRFGELPFLKEQMSVSICVYSHDGRMLAIGGMEGNLSIYDTTTWSRAYQHYDSGDGRVLSAAFSPNNQQLVCEWNLRTRLWNFANSDTILDLKGSPWVISVVFSPCDKQFASVHDDRTVRSWNSETGECVFVLRGHTGGIAGVAYSSDGKRLVSGSTKDGTIRVWDSETGEPIACWNIAHEKDSHLAISADGKWIVVVFEDKIQITNAFTGEPGPVLNGNNTYRCMASFSNGLWIVTSTADNTLRLWDISSGLLISSFSGHAHQIVACNFSPSGSQLASGDGGGYVRLWEIDTSGAILDLDRPTSRVLTVIYSPDGRSILSRSSVQGLQQWDSLTGVFVPLPLKMGDDVSLLTFSPDGKQIATGHNDGAIRLWSREADTAECTLLGRAGSVTRLDYSPCGRWIVSVSAIQARLWDLHTNEHPGVIVSMKMFTQAFFCVTMAATGQIVLNPDSGTLRLYDPRTQDPCSALKEISVDFVIRSLDCSPDGQKLVIGSFDGIVYLRDFRSDKLCVELKGHGTSVDAVAYSPCGKWILASGDDKVRVWRLRTGEVSSWSCVAVVGGCSKRISRLAWKPAVALEFVTGCDDGSIRVWRIMSHEDADGGDVSVQMLWGNNVGLLCTSKLIFRGAIGLSPMNQRLLVQRGAIDGSPPSERHEANGEEAD